MTAPENNELGFSPDASAQRKAELMELLSQVAPDLISDNQLVIDRLKELLGEDHTAPAEHYELNWAGKAAARREIQKTTSHTLLPFPDNPPQAQHMLIEGENLEVLRVLQKSYYGKIKMIYIDPPYNTGNDSFVYPDDYSETLEEYQKRTGEKNDSGFLNKQSLWKINSKESGQYHSAWLSMMYPRLYLARNLLREDGVIFISIDDNEAANLKLICDEVFGLENFRGEIVRATGTTTGQDGKKIGSSYDICLCYSKSDQFKQLGLPLIGKDLNRFSNDDNDGRGKYALLQLRKTGNADRKEDRENMFYAIKAPDESLVYPIGPTDYLSRWRVAESSYKKMQDDGLIVWKKNSDSELVDEDEDEDELPDSIQEKSNDSKEAKFAEKYDIDKLKSDWRPYVKYYLAGRRKQVSNLWADIEGNKKGSIDLRKLFKNKKVFDNPKPIEFIQRLIRVSCNEQDTMLDFFAGSGTSMHAALLNTSPKIRCICVQFPEPTFEIKNGKEVPKSGTSGEAYKAGYRTITDITRARIESVIANLNKERPDEASNLTCANFTLSPSGFKVWRSDVANEETMQNQLAMFRTTQKEVEKSTEINADTAMLSELLLKYGLGALGVHAISKPKDISDITVHRVLMQDDKYLWLCFDPYTEALKDEILKSRPAQVILLNSCFTGDKADEKLSNLQLEMANLDIGLTVI